MMSTLPHIEELRAHIAKLSTEIDLQKQVLEDLERDKSFMQGQLNVVLDPVARLPLEISSEIFLHSLPSFPEPGNEHVPMLFLNICHAWADIALSTPELWSGIQITFPCTATYEDGAEAWLRRACNRPLSISLWGPGFFEAGATDMIWRHSQQLRHLELCYQKELEEEDSDEDDYEVDIDLLGCEPKCLPSLKTLAIRGLTSLNEDQAYIGSQILNLLRLAPNLVDCSIEHVSNIRGLDKAAESLAIPTLRHLSLEGPCSIWIDDEILNCLSLPGLASLSLPMVNISVGDLLSFLKRSSPPLRALVMDAPMYRGAERLHDCLRLVPTLTRFELREPGSALMEELFTMLAEGFSPQVPDLNSIVIYRCSPTITDSSWKKILRALAQRRATLRSVQINIPTSRSIPSDVLAGFKNMVADGMHLYIGSEESNFLSI
ncbi:hypothetical protein DFH06DRAFT_1040463 [Mycena polygramma]|nr:hypothetical protein DFH06DRAFT_1040463 [Mycena polygramma]